MRNRLLGCVALAALTTVAGCGGCGDDAPAEPDAEIDDPAPDAEIPDAMPSVVGPVTGLDASPGVTAGSVDATWSNPTGLTEVIIVRRVGAPVASAPVDGTTYVVGGTLGAGDEIVYVGTGESFSDVGLPPGFAHYAAFARNEVATWATPAATDSALVAAAAQTATITVVLSATSATVTSQPADYTLAASMTYDGGLDELTVHVDATSGFARNVFAPKAEITAVSQGAITGDGTLDTFPFVRLGQAIAPAATAGADLLFTGVDGAMDTITIDLTLVDNRAGVLFSSWEGDAAYEWLDPATNTTMGTVACDALIYVDNTQANCAYMPGAISADGTRIYAGNRGLPLVREIDAATGAVLRTLSLDAGLGGVRNVELSADGHTLYAGLILGGHVFAGENLQGAIADVATATVDGAVVKIDVATLTEVGRLVVLDDGAYLESRLGTLDVSPGGAQLAIPIRNDASATLHLVDTSAMTLIQAVDLGTVLTTFAARQVVYDSTGASAYVRASYGDVLAKVDVGTFAVTGVTLPGAGITSTTNGGDLIAGASGVVYVTRQPDTAGNELFRVDGTTVTPSSNGIAASLGVLDDRLFVVGNTIRVFDAATLVQEALPLNPIDNTWSAHGIRFTPY